MKAVFADTLYWVALLDVRDAWHERALRAGRQVGRATVVTTDSVILEVMNTFCESGPTMRDHVVRFVRQLLGTPGFDVVAQDRSRLMEAIDFYGKRQDKGYSLTDCFSMRVMSERGLSEILTNDHHSAQEGFTVLIPDTPMH